MPILYVKVLHIVLVMSWFSGLFYLPRIFVNLAQETNTAAYDRLVLMATKLYKFMTILAIFALASGIILYAMMGKQGVWMHIKLFLVFIALGYHHSCKILLSKFVTKTNKKSHLFYRWYNEVPVLILLIITYLVIVKPL